MFLQNVLQAYQVWLSTSMDESIKILRNFGNYCVFVCFFPKVSFMKTDNNFTPFFPGIAHSQFMRFRVPSAFFIGTATNPWNVEKGWLCKERFKDHVLTENVSRVFKIRAHSPPLRRAGAYLTLLTKGWSFLHALRSCVSRLNAMPDMICGLLQIKTMSWNNLHHLTGGAKHNLDIPVGFGHQLSY